MAEVGAFRERVMAVRDMSEGEGEEMLLDWTSSGSTWPHRWQRRARAPRKRARIRGQASCGGHVVRDEGEGGVIGHRSLCGVEPL